MAVSIAYRDHVGGHDRDGSSKYRLVQRRFAGAALVCIGFGCAFTLWTNLAQRDGYRVPTPPEQAAHAVARIRASSAAVAAGYAKLAAALNGPRAYFDPGFLNSPPGKLSPIPNLVAENGAIAPARATLIAATQSATAERRDGDDALKGGTLPRLGVPQARNVSLGDLARTGRPPDEAPAEQPTIFEKLFGRSQPPALAYASPDDGVAGLWSGRYDRVTAVYDISAHTVYLPDGSKLEAHSGLGARLDDPRFTDERMRGATPATLYDLQPRESPFHGVQALRLVPLDASKVFGRSGLLAHTFMLGPNGQSNGCVSFRNYNAFLQAYLSGKIKRLAVVSRLD